MEVEISLAEMLLNAIGAGKIPGVQFKRGVTDELAAFKALNVVIGNKLDAAKRVAIQEALRDQPVLKLKAVATVARHVCDSFACHCGGDPHLPSCVSPELDDLRARLAAAGIK